jgi:protocatechuate 3,4-dioxygenase beta subunit
MSRLGGFITVLAGLTIAPGCPGADTGTQDRAREPIVGLPCEGCEAVFEGLPPAPETDARICRKDEPGQPLRVDGTVFDAAGHPAAGIIVYAYQTDSRGIYPADDRYRGFAAYHHGLLRGWAKTDAGGRYSFATIRPAGYPDSDIPAHIHMHVIEVGRCTYYIDDILFADDPRLTSEKKAALTPGRGGSGLVVPQSDSSGGWVVRRDIHLGRNIPGYPGRARRQDPAGR